MSSKEDVVSDDGPLDEAWWLDESCEGAHIPPVDAPLLAPYEKTRPGYEVLAGDTCERWGDIDFLAGEKGQDPQVCLWNLFERDRDPADDDEEKRLINRMQSRLGALTDDDRYIRIQIACVKRCWWDLENSLNAIIEGIASGDVNLNHAILCEPPWAWICRVLRHRRGIHLDEMEQRGRLLRAYLNILTSWVAGLKIESVKNELAEHSDLLDTIYRRLGPPTELKLLQVERLRSSMTFELRPKCFDIYPHLMKMKEVFSDLIKEEGGGSEDPLNQLIEWNMDRGLCHHSYFRHVDHQIAHIGAGRPVELPGTGVERNRVISTVVNHVHALGSCVANRTIDEAIRIWPPSVDVVRHVYSVLGDPVPRKRWLAACLWKTLQETDAHCGRGALDDSPEVFHLSTTVLSAEI